MSVILTSPQQDASPPPQGPPPWLRRYTIWTLVVIGGGFFVWWVLNQLIGLLVTLLCSFFLAFAVEPAVNWLAARGWRRGAATLTVFLVMLVGVALFLLAVGSLLAQQILDLVDTIPDAVDDLSDWAQDEFGLDLSSGVGDVSGSLGSIGGSLAGTVIGVGASLVGLLFQFFTVLLFTYYLAAYGPQFRRTVCSVLPPDRQREILRVWDIAIDKTAGFIYSRTVLAAFSATASTVFFWIIGLPYALTLGLFVGIVSQFIPTVGTYIAIAIPALIGLTESPAMAIAVIAFGTVYQQIENYLLSPKISARTMEIQPAVAFGAVIAGAAILGPIGAFLALPFVATVQAFISTYVTRHDLVDDELLKDVERNSAAAIAGDPVDPEGDDARPRDPDA